MKICVIGAGSIGGLLAAKFAQSGQDVSVVARGAHLAAIREKGLVLQQQGARIVARVVATDRIADVAAPDLVVLGMKSHQIAAVAVEVARILGPESVLLAAQNGMPWWYFFKHGGPHEGVRLHSVDPGGTIADNLPIDRVIAGVSYPAAEIEAPGVIRHTGGYRFTLGEIDGAETTRLAAISQAFARAGFEVAVTSDVRTELWTKLWGNLCFNPISALTRATLADICGDPLTRALAAQMMREAQTVAEAFGIRLPMSVDKRIAATASIGAHKTSMLQDVENGRAIEVDALLGSVLELARMANIAAPNMDAVYALTKSLGRRSH